MAMQYVNPHNVEWLVPSWVMPQYTLSKCLDKLLIEHYATHKARSWSKPLRFWIELRLNEGTIVLKEPEVPENDLCLGQLGIQGDGWGISVPINDFLKGAPDARGSHTLYAHSIESATPLRYFGITKRPWYERYAEHKRSAEQGSPFLFHRALRQHAGTEVRHRIIFGHLTHDQAMGQEEKFVESFGLYPLGLNMIPGGFAGIRYLHKLGITTRDAVERDAQTEALAARPSIEGRPNPLCAARWESDPDFAERVICGHSGRLTAEQVRAIRSLGHTGQPLAAIAALVGDRVDRVRRVLTGKRYARVA